MRLFFKLLTISALVLAVTACNTNSTSKEVTPLLQEQYPDVLNLRNAPDSVRHYGLSSFSDLGAWHSFALPEEGNAGTFPGPFLMTQGDGEWMSAGLSQLQLVDSETGKSLNTDQASDFKTHYYPGKLWQSFRLGELSIEMELIFVSDRTSLVKTTVKNTADKLQNLIQNWTGSYYAASDQAFVKGTILIPLKERGLAKLTFEEGPYQMSSHTEVNRNSYALRIGEPHTLSPGEVIEFYHTTSVYFDSEEEQKDQDNITKALKNPEVHFAANAERWNGYLERVLDLKYPEYDVVAVKALNTLMNNWRSPAQDLHYNGLFPSYAYRGFHGVWSWDSWKHAVALVKFAPELAKDQMRVMYDYQDEMGMVPDVIYRNKEWNNWRDTKPPLSAWAIWKIYEVTSDRAFLEEMYPKVLKYHKWWYIYRDHDQNGLCEYGSTDGTRIAAAWESGMDNAVRFDDAIMLKNNEQGWSLNQESVDLNAYLYAEKQYLSQMAEVLGFIEDKTALDQEAEALKDAIGANFYSEEAGYFYDKVISSTELKQVEGTEGWTPLWARVATQAQADKVFEIMLDTSKFDTFVPLPTFTKDHPKFNPRNGYWRGPVWLDQVYFGVQAFEQYGRPEAAEKVIRKLIANADGLKEKGTPIHENYHPVTGERLNARHFSWSSAHLLLMLLNE
ncbi:MAG: glycoside hydrolase [Roseivirga sp.]|nr:glycoside hydrolase [Roseivirga sp.]